MHQIAFEKLGKLTISAKTTDQSKRSGRLLEKMGFQFSINLILLLGSAKL